MADQHRDNRDAKRSDDYVKGKHGDAPGDTEDRSEGAVARHENPRYKRSDGQKAQKIDQSSGSE
jgi:hypothetical protein